MTRATMLTPVITMRPRVDVVRVSGGGGGGDSGGDSGGGVSGDGGGDGGGESGGSGDGRVGGSGGGGGGGKQRGPQSLQSVPSEQMLHSDPGPPSLQSPSDAAL